MKTGGPSPDASRRALAALFFATVTVFSDLYITQPILPLLSREFGVPAPTAALTLSVVVLMIALVSNGWGPLADAFGRKPVMVFSGALLAVPTFLCAAAPNLEILVFLRALQGIFVPGVTAVAVAYLGDQFAGPKLGPAVGGWVAASVTGGLTGRVVSGWIASHLSWRAPFLVFGIVFNLGLGVLSRLMPQMQVYFVGMPLSILAGFLILLLIIGAMMTNFLGQVEAVLVLERLVAAQDVEPPNARPVIIEDGCFIGSRTIVVEGVRVGRTSPLELAYRRAERVATAFRTV